MSRCSITRCLLLSKVMLFMLSIISIGAQDIQFLDDTKNDRIYYPDKQRLNFGRHTYGRATTESNELTWWQAHQNHEHIYDDDTIDNGSVSTRTTNQVVTCAMLLLSLILRKLYN